MLYLNNNNNNNNKIGEISQFYWELSFFFFSLKILSNFFPSFDKFLDIIILNPIKILQNLISSKPYLHENNKIYKFLS